MDDGNVRICGIETVALIKGKLIRVSYEQQRRDGEWQSRKREVYEQTRPSFFPTIPIARPCCSPGNAVVLIQYLRDRLART